MTIDISLKFQTIDEALEVLSKLRSSSNDKKKKEELVVVKKKSVESKGKYKGMPYASLDSVLDILKNKYVDCSFRWNEAVMCANEAGFSKSLCGYAMRYAVGNGQLHKLSYGKYSFRASESAVKKQQFTLDKDSLIDIVASEKETTKILSIFRLMGRVCRTAALYFNEQGMSARFFTNEDRSALLSVFVGKDMFDGFHIKSSKHIRLQLSISSLLNVLPRRKNGEFHMKFEKENATVVDVGYRGNEHIVNVIGCEVSNTPFEVENPLEEPKDYAELQIGRSFFQDRIQDVYAHSDTVRIAISKDKVVIDSSLESPGYSKSLTANDGGIQIRASQSIEQCFTVQDLLSLVRHRIVGHDSLTLKMNKQVMMMDIAREKNLQVSAYVSPCKIETVPHKVTKTDLKEIAERIAKLEKDMHIS